MNIIGHSIQEYLKKINSGLNKYSLISLLLTLLILLSFVGYIYKIKNDSYVPLSYIENSGRSALNVDASAFASISGKTYTFNWCSGSEKILEKNKIYFKDVLDAEKSGRTLSENCK